ncbi:hypothetical protein [Minwuia sp.]|uniref:hypothetical protein n=1 Tax=Minwuia sp. TaxID=2493630 RepID=UPI003A8D371F
MIRAFWKRLRIAAAALFLCLPATVAPAQDEEIEIVRVAEVGIWQIIAIIEKDGPLQQCMATVLYENGQRISFNAQPDGAWAFQVFDPNWPPRFSDSMMSVQVSVGDQRLEEVKAEYVGKSLFLRLHNAELYLMQQDGVLQIQTPTDPVSFILVEPKPAIGATAICRDAQKNG